MSDSQALATIVYTGLFLLIIVGLMVCCIIWMLVLSFSKGKRPPSDKNVYKTPRTILLVLAIIFVVGFGLCSATVFLPEILK